MKKGFTLTETVVVISVFTLVMFAAVGAIVQFYRTNSFTIEQAFAVQTAELSIKELVRGIREATFSDEGAYPVITIATSSFMFYSDIDLDESVELIRYAIDGTTLYQERILASSTVPVYASASQSTTTVATDVRNFEDDISLFRYFDDTGTEILDFNDVTDVAFVEVTLIVNVNPARAPNEFTLRSSATSRNLKTNL